MKVTKERMKPGRKRGVYIPRPPDPDSKVAQKTMRLPRELADRTEERCIEEAMRLGVDVTFSHLVRRGLEMVLATELPATRRDLRKCDLVESPVEGQPFCTTCAKRVVLGQPCPTDGQVVTL